VNTARMRSRLPMWHSLEAIPTEEWRSNERRFTRANISKDGHSAGIRFTPSVSRFFPNIRILLKLIPQLSPILRSLLHPLDLSDSNSQLLCRRDQLVVIVMSKITVFRLVSSLPSLFYTVSSHRDIYIYECQGMITRCQRGVDTEAE
jgi:hypothetical protein